MTKRLEEIRRILIGIKDNVNKNSSNNTLHTLSKTVNILSFIVNIIPFIILYIFILPLSRYITKRRKLRKIKPRLVWGPHPIINIKYISNLLKRRYGYISKTIVYEVYHINKDSDFDFVIKVCKNNLINKLFVRFFAYYIFLCSLLKFDIFNYYYSGGFLSVTLLKYLELKLLKLAGKKCVLMQFGSDVTIPSRIKNKYKWNIGKVIYEDYPNYDEKIALKNIRYFTNDADYIIGVGELVEFIPRFDTVLPISSIIDPKEWKPKIKTGNKVIKIVHAPNHPSIKGTKYLEEACKKLKEKGYQIELKLVRGIRNDIAKKIYEEADIIADQFIIGWYALFAAEGMALGKPVLCYIRDNLLKINNYAIKFNLPIVNTNPDNLHENLLRLIKNRGLRMKLGILGRKYIISTVDYTIDQLHKIYEKLWMEV